MKYKYSNLRYKPYWNGWRVYYEHKNGNKEYMGYTALTKQYAVLLGRNMVDYLNGKEV